MALAESVEYLIAEGIAEAAILSERTCSATAARLDKIVSFASNLRLTDRQDGIEFNWWIIRQDTSNQHFLAEEESDTTTESDTASEEENSDGGDVVDEDGDHVKQLQMELEGMRSELQHKTAQLEAAQKILYARENAPHDRETHIAVKKQRRFSMSQLEDEASSRLKRLMDFYTQYKQYVTGTGWKRREAVALDEA